MERSAEAPFKAQELKDSLLNQDPEFCQKLKIQSNAFLAFDELFSLSNLRRKALKMGRLPSHSTGSPMRLALIGGYSLYPLRELIEHLLWARNIEAEVFTGEYDNYISEIMNPESALYQFRPTAALIIPPARRFCYQGPIADSVAKQRTQAHESVEHLLNLCNTLHQRSGAEILLCNFVPSAHHDLGPMRTRSLASDWNFKRLLNLELGLSSPAYVHICDLEFLAAREGLLTSKDEKGWFETKQLGAPDFLVEVARDAAHCLSCLKSSAKKVLVLDLDNTLWGGVIGDDGLEGIVLGDTSARGEAFKEFQKYIASLTQRGFLLAVCSKNDHANAIEPFEKHPEMILKLDQIVSFKANWNPKSENIRSIAEELNVGLDSLVFVDDNPAEIEIVRQFAPEVATICLGPDPAEYVAKLQDSRLFEVQSITEEDKGRTLIYQQEAQRKSLRKTITDMPTYLRSLEMAGEISEFTIVDASRLSQLINKSNQFNVTTRRRSEAEVLSLITSQDHTAFSFRLTDKFGDHGLIAIFIGKIRKAEKILEIDTWLMSCRVLERQVEHETLNEIVRLAQKSFCDRIFGIYIPTAKNGMVKDLFLKMGFQPQLLDATRSEYILDAQAYKPVKTQMTMTRRVQGINNESNRDSEQTSNHL